MQADRKDQEKGKKRWSAAENKDSQAERSAQMTPTPYSFVGKCSVYQEQAR